MKMQKKVAKALSAYLCSKGSAGIKRFMVLENTNECMIWFYGDDDYMIEAVKVPSSFGSVLSAALKHHDNSKVSK